LSLLLVCCWPRKYLFDNKNTSEVNVQAFITCLLVIMHVYNFFSYEMGNQSIYRYRIWSEVFIAGYRDEIGSFNTVENKYTHSKQVSYTDSYDFETRLIVCM
jgi:hypothetical protein